MGTISGDFTFRSNFTNTEVNRLNAEQASPSSFNEAENVTTYSREEQENLLSSYLSNFDGYSARSNSSGAYYFSRTNDDGTTDAIRVVNDNGTTKIIHSTVLNGSAETEVFEITKVDEFNHWGSSQSNMDSYMAGEEVEGFEMFALSGEAAPDADYAQQVQNFAQDIITKFDTSGDGVLDLDEFILMSTNGKGIQASVEDQLKAQYENIKDVYPSYEDFIAEMGGDDFITSMVTAQESLFNALFSGLSFDDDEGHINSGELATLLYAADANTETGDVDGVLDYSNYQTIPLLNPEANYFAEDTSEIHQAWQGIQQSFYDKYYK